MQTVAAVGMMEGKLVVGLELFFVGFPVKQVVIWQRQAATGAAVEEELGPQCSVSLGRRQRLLMHDFSACFSGT